MIVLEIRPLFTGMADPTHVGHPPSQRNTRLTREDIVCHMTVATGGRVFLPLHQRPGMGTLQIILVFLGMTLLTFFVIEKKCGYPSKEFWIRMFYTFFLDV